MNNELTQKLVRRFPVLYQDFYESPRNTCMCWGFDHGDGWFDIIWQLSLALEDELGYSGVQKHWLLFKKRFFKRYNNFWYKLSPPVHNKTKIVKGDDNVWRHVVVEKVYPRDQWLRNLLVKVLPERSSHMHSTIGHFQRLGLKGFVHHPNTGFSVQQVKEKFGGLRYYCPGNERIFRLIRFAEILSKQTCEVCGKPGKLESPHGWMSTVCKEHSRLEPIPDAPKTEKP